MTPNPYDVIPYPTIPRAQLHPGRLAAVGRLFGLEPAPVARCRVLEIGCGDGGNLIPMAYFLPESRFTGVDLAAAPIAAAQHMASALEMRNLDLRVGDLREIDEAWGEFDYILAPGVYSWVPEDARDALLTVCRERLAAQGIAYISYNAYPGGHLRQALREMMLHQARDASGPRETVRIAREFLQQLQRAGALAPAWHELRDHEVKALLERDDGALYHDDLAEWNQRFYFHEFMAAANGHGLDYVGEADLYEMFDPQSVLTGFQGTVVDYEQTMDFLKARRFRQTLLCRVENDLKRRTEPEQMAEFLFSAPGRRLDDGQIEGARGVTIRTSNEAAVAVAVELGKVYPRPVAFQELLPLAGNAQLLATMLYEMAITGFVDLHVFDFPRLSAVSDRPRATGLTRYQAERSNEVTSIHHVNLTLDDIARRLVGLLDGIRDRRQIAAALGIGHAPELLAPGLEWLRSRGLLDA